MNKPYLLIAGESYYPDFGVGDWKKCFETKDEALSNVKEVLKYSHNGRNSYEYEVLGQKYDWYEIVDLREWTDNESK